MSRSSTSGRWELRDIVMAKARILVVDDDCSTVMQISSVLKMHGFEVFTAFEGLDGLRLAAEVKPHLIILEIMIPQIDGYQVVRCLKHNPETAGIAVLILSVKGNIDEDVKQTYEFARRVQDRLEGFDSGALDFLTKPVRGNDLVRRVKALLWASGFPL